MSYAQLPKGDMIVAASRFGADAYEAAGGSMPADLEEYSQRDGVRQSLPILLCGQVSLNWKIDEGSKDK